MIEKESTRKGFGKALLELAGEREDIIAASADTYRSFALGDFVDKYPDRYYEYGIAEQCMITASAAMAKEGYQVYCVGYSPFLSMRAVEQIRTFCCYPNLDVKIVAGLGGITGDTDGVTHQGTEDIGIIRTIPNITLVSPADYVAAAALTKEVSKLKTPVYLRLGRGATPIYYSVDQKFEIGRAVTARDYGRDAAIIATGVCVGEAMKAADALNKEGIKVTVLDMHTIKPLDENAVISAVNECKNLLVVEDGSVYGGLSGAVSEVLVKSRIMPDHYEQLGLSSFGTTGTVPQLLKFLGLDEQAIKEHIINMMK